MSTKTPPARPPLPSTEERQIRQLLEGWADAVRRHDLAGVVAHHAEDVVFFDVPPPTQVRGLSAYRQSWPPFFEYIGEAGQFDLAELKVVAGADVAFAHANLLVRGDAEASSARVRLTVGLRKINGQWTVVHEHHSAPYESGGG
ncbi:MAG TPA: nuclear transport factor 2 family protein [Polyangiaceae bacterium]|nr:nuclear transport factor 2 family protein [Polyangiaceae bacterium]